MEHEPRLISRRQLGTILLICAIITMGGILWVARCTMPASAAARLQQVPLKADKVQVQEIPVNGVQIEQLPDGTPVASPD